MRKSKMRSHSKSDHTPARPPVSILSVARSGLLGVGVFSFFINMLMLVTPLYMLQIYDRVLVSGSHETLFYLTVLAAGLIVMNGGLEFVRSRLLVRVAGRLDLHLSTPVFRSLFERSSGGTLALLDMTALRNFISGNGPNAFFDAPWTPAFIALIFVFHPLLGLVALGGAVVLFVIALCSEFTTRGTYKQAADQARDAMGFAEATVRNQEAVKGMGMVPQLTQRWRDKNFAAIGTFGSANDMVGLLTALSKIVRPSLQIAMLGSGAYLALQEIISPGVMIAASIIMGRALAPVEQAVSQWRSFISARSAYGRLKEVLADSVDMKNRTSLPRPKGHVSVEAMTLVPPGSERPVLRNVTFSLTAGDVLAVIGASASGKSSLARALTGVWPQTTGHVRLDGADLSQWIPEELGQYVGYLPQTVELFEGSVAENIARFLEPDPKKVLAAAKLAGAHEMILRLEDGYDTSIGPGGSALSGGQRQRLGLARALYDDPAFIVLDEPNANLDSYGEQALMNTVTSLKEKGRTVVLISHRTNILNVVDKILLLANGRVERFGPKQEVLPLLMGQPKVVKPVEQIALSGQDISGTMGG